MQERDWHDSVVMLLWKGHDSGFHIVSLLLLIMSTSFEHRTLLIST